MAKVVVRVITNIIIIIGFILLGRVLWYGLNGVLAQQYFPPAQGSVIKNAYALGLSLPIPLHVIAVGMVLQLRWLSPTWARMARWAVVVSGCWLGLALGVRWLAL
jgi:amino acid permease